MNNVKKSINNVMSSLGGQLITIILGIIIPRLVLVNLGSNANGLMNSVNSFVGYLSLLEAGVGGATSQALYKPIAEDDKLKINGILAATDHFYRRTGTVYFLLVLGASFVYILGNNTELSNLSIFIVVMVTGMSGVFSYWIQGKYRLLVNADGKSYLLTNLTTCITMAISITKIILLSLGFNIIALQLMYFAYNILQIVIFMCMIRKMYPWIDLKVQPDYTAIEKKNSVFVHQVSTLIFNNTDMLILSFFCGFKVVSVYALYNMLLNMIRNAIDAFSGSITFWLGQQYQVNREKYIKMNDIYEVYSMTLGTSLFCVATAFITPFIRIYTKGVTDIGYIDPYLSILFAFIFILQIGRSASLQTISFAGHFQETLSQTIIESVINLSVSIICVIKFGIYGVLLGTIAALLYRTNDMILYTSHKLLKRSAIFSYKRWITNILLFFVFFIIVSSKVSDLDSYMSIIGYACVITPCILTIFIIINSVVNFKVFKNLICLIKNRKNR